MFTEGRKVGVYDRQNQHILAVSPCLFSS